MIAAAILAHVLNIAHGIGASLACAGCFSIAGLVLVPRRWDGALGHGESAAMLGAALYVLVAWFGIIFGIPLTRLSVGFISVALLLALARYRWCLDAIRARTKQDAVGWVLAFGVIYVLAYLFTMPPATADYLPPAWTGNVDLLTYARYARYLQLVGPLGLSGGFPQVNGGEYLQTPAAFSLLGWFSVFFGQDPLAAVMPTQFALTALIGVLVARISRSVFLVPRALALLIGSVVVSGPFFRYVSSAYFLSTLMSMPILLYVIWKTVSYRSLRFVDVGAVIQFGSAYVLLLFIYPLLLLAALASQTGAIVLMLVADLQSRDGDWRESVRRAARTACAVLVPLGLLVLCLSERVMWSMGALRDLARKGFAGWPLDIISPLAVLGLPGMATDHGHIELTNPTSRAWALVAFCAIALALGFLFFWTFRQRTTPAQRTLVGLASGAFLLYCTYFLYLGPSYQQWKFASYSILPLSFVVLAGGWQALRQTAAFARTTDSVAGDRRIAALAGVLGVALVGGNLLIHAQSEAPLVRFPGTLRNLAMVDKLPFFREMVVKMDEGADRFAVWLALYFLPTKDVRVVSTHYRPNEPLSFERISRQRPLLIQNYGCEGVGHEDTMTVPDVGCLLLAPPSLTFMTSYPFNRSFLFVDFDGLGPREPQGRWNSRPEVTFELTADLRRTWVYQETYVNFRLRPRVSTTTPRQRLQLSWGMNQHAELALSTREWISLPVGSSDWSGDKVRTLPITIVLPDGAEPHWAEGPEGRHKEERPLAVVFEDLSITVTPIGRVVTRTAAAVR